ncbi:hypothetical protein H696_03001 [Fonticula alba]|uniref:Uncharacterized protein n=1 Tax=Fonticula alba TaxID=691883 RepID=A0A058Z969_FONAL|nr:hypothetical protein H696_03001 [Fonticula alba]KCV70646.1 hypothetical protein H696_03001 [Fonticula alba]|eukprot:XP_009495162.1 hypothetical protein H696_03001 [Fonticula alba]
MTMFGYSRSSGAASAGSSQSSCGEDSGKLTPIPRPAWSVAGLGKTPARSDTPARRGADVAVAGVNDNVVDILPPAIDTAAIGVGSSTPPLAAAGDAATISGVVTVPAARDCAYPTPSPAGPGADTNGASSPPSDLPRPSCPAPPQIRPANQTGISPPRIAAVTPLVIDSLASDGCVRPTTALSLPPFVEDYLQPIRQSTPAQLEVLSLRQIACGQACLPEASATLIREACPDPATARGPAAALAFATVVHQFLAIPAFSSAPDELEPVVHWHEALLDAASTPDHPPPDSGPTSPCDSDVDFDLIVMVDRLSGVPVALSAAEFYPRSSALLLTYLVVAPDRRGLGLSRPLSMACIEFGDMRARQRGLGPQAKIALLETRGHDDSESDATKSRAAAALSRLGFRAVVGLKYVQPALEEAGCLDGRCYNMLLCVHERHIVSDEASAPAPTVDAMALSSWLAEYYSTLGVAPDDEDLTDQLNCLRSCSNGRAPVTAVF